MSVGVKKSFDFTKCFEFSLKYIKVIKFFLYLCFSHPWVFKLLCSIQHRKMVVQSIQSLISYIVSEMSYFYDILTCGHLTIACSNSQEQCKKASRLILNWISLGTFWSTFWSTFFIHYLRILHFSWHFQPKTNFKRPFCVFQLSRRFFIADLD